MKNINIGIDLGTTNSAIAEYQEGKVILHRNPIDFSELLPSVVSFKNNRILIGHKAKEKIRADHQSTFASFKRKMGVQYTFEVEGVEETINPISLSAYVLKELKSFLINKEIKQAVITIPASFDTLQSNATKEAGYLAGFEEVVLLQEPIAACIAYSNLQQIDLKDDVEQWLVYDFGGGTFDISLAKVSNRELEIIDHQGNNFLGGVDIDQLMIQEIICKSIEKEYPNHDKIWDKMISKYDLTHIKFYYELLHKVEEAKKELSLREIVFIDIFNQELNISQEIELKRSVFNETISKKFEVSYQLVAALLNDNNLQFEDIARIILVGGTTYLPYIREELSNRTGIYVDKSIDPTTAVAIGAAYFAGSKVATTYQKENETSQIEINAPVVEWIYESQTNDTEELIVGLIEQNFKGFYRISRMDGGFDSGLVQFQKKISQFVQLLPRAKNTFKIQLFNSQQLLNLENSIEISHGLYTILGQPVPNDICIELDGDGYTYLEKIFSKNDVLPLKKTVYKTISKTILKNTNDYLSINVLEGDVRDALETNLLIGHLTIAGDKIPFDLIKGMDIEIVFMISESRDLSIEVLIDSIGFSMNQVFSPSYRNVDLKRVQWDIKCYIDMISDKLNENQGSSKILNSLALLRNELISLYGQVIENLENELTDIKYQIDDEKRNLIKKIDALIRNEDLMVLIENYHEVKTNVISFENKMDETQKKHFETIVRSENQFIASGNRNLISKKTDDLDQIYKALYKKSDDYYLETFYLLKHNINLQSKVINRNYHLEMIDKGETALKNNRITELKVILSNMVMNLDINVREDKNLKDLSSKLGLE